jgi:PglZ domain.
MIAKWFNEDIENILLHHNRVVVTDSAGEGAFLMKCLPEEYIVLKANDKLSEIEAKYKAEKEYPHEKVVFYTSIKREKLSFLLEYAETCGIVELNNMEFYLKDKLYSKLNKNVTLSRNELILAAKCSNDKDEKWWLNVIGGSITPLSIKENILKFLQNPNRVKDEMDAEIWDIFSIEIYKLIGKPATQQSTETFANEIVSVLLNGLLNNNINDTLLDIYYQWTDSVENKSSLQDYINSFNLPKVVNCWNCHPDHCFKEIDELCFRSIGECLSNGTFYTELAQFISRRMSSKKAISFKPEWWNGLLDLLNYQPKEINKLSSLKGLADYYTKNFSKLDTALRICYVYFLNDPEIIAPWQRYYEQLNSVLLDKWYSMVDEYADTQQGYLKNIFEDATKRTAVIVCDGLRLEIANRVIAKLPKSLKIDKNTGFAALPSVTENCMSAIYIGDGTVEMDKSVREAGLSSLCKGISFISLENLNGGVIADKLVLSYGEIDYVSEKEQQAALKAFATYETYLGDRIAYLFKLGYEEVYLTTDHGFVLTGHLMEADKIQIPTGYSIKKNERFLLSNDELSLYNTICRKGNYMGWEYQYYAKSDKPFVTTGAYGYAHGGFTPQEVIIPQFKIYQSGTEIEGLKVTIINKKELKEVAGAMFSVKLKGTGKEGDTFESERKIVLQLFTNGKLIQSSQIITLRVKQTMSLEFPFGDKDAFTIVIVDALSTKQLDSCEIKKGNFRDLGGLL